MRISYRDNLLKQANNPNQYPWNSSNRSNENPKDGQREVKDDRPKALQMIMDVKMDKGRKVKKQDMSFISWESINSLGDRLETDEEEEERDADKK